MPRGRAVIKNGLSDPPASVLKSRFIGNLRRLMEDDPELREEGGQTILTKRMGIKSPSYINNMLGGRASLSIDRVEKFAVIFGVDPGVFFLPDPENIYFQEIMKKKIKD